MLSLHLNINALKYPAPKPKTFTKTNLIKTWKAYYKIPHQNYLRKAIMFLTS